MDRRRRARKTGRLVGATALVLATAAPALGTWRPVRPAPGLSRFRLVPAVAEGAGEAEAARKISYYLLEPGDTLSVELRGHDRVRVSARPIYGDGEAYEFFRYTVSFGEDHRKRYKRRARGEERLWAEFVPEGREAVPLGVAYDAGRPNHLALEVPPGADRFRVWMNETDGKSAFVRVLVSGGPRKVAGTRRPATRSGFRLAIEAGLGGFDSNAYLVPEAADSAVSAYFWPLDVKATYRARLSRSWSFRGSYGFDGDLYEDSLLHDTRHAILLVERWKPRRGMAWTFEQRVRRRDDTFVGRGDRTEFETTAGSGDRVSLADRFDYVDYRFRTKGRIPLSRRVSFLPGGSVLSRDYVEDFEAFPDIYSLDYVLWAADIGLGWEPGDRWRIDLSGELDWKVYDEKFSRDAQGALVPDAATFYFDRRLGLEVRHGGRIGNTFAIGGSWTRREDRHAGYWDQDVLGLTVEAGRKWAGGHRLTATFGRSATSYDRARVGYVPAGALRDKDRSRFTLRGRLRVYPGVDLVGTYRYDDADNNTPTFAYTRSQLDLGISTRL